MRDEMRKNYQRKFNKLIHTLNRSIEKDELWRGRFVFFQKDAHFYKFDDNSGGEFYVYVRGYDKKTGYYKDDMILYAPWSEYKLWETANNFIVKMAEVWEEQPRPSVEDAEDFTNVKIDVQELNKKDWNFYLSAKYFDRL